MKQLAMSQMWSIRPLMAVNEFLIIVNDLLKST